MSEDTKYHAIKVNPNRCIGCTHCMKACPTEAIRLREGVATINDIRCVDCGNCMRACPVHAFYVEQDGFEQLKAYKYRVILFPAVLVGQVSTKYSVDQIYQGLLNMGFTHAFEVEQPVQILIDANRAEVKSAEEKPVISSFCPAIVRLIQCKYPSLVEHIAQLKAPHDLAAHYAIRKLEEEGISREDTGIFYASPCSAKIAAVKRPLGEKESVVDGLINMSELYNKLMKALPSEEECRTTDFWDDVSRDGIVWSLPRGEARHFKGRSMAIDGIHNVVKYLERLENEEVPESDFLELKSCDQGCAGGILMTGNRFLTVERLQKRSKKYLLADRFDSDSEMAKDLMSTLRAESIEPNPVFTLDVDRAKAIEKLEKVGKILCQLPGIDCGGCGAPNCHALAEDMVQGLAKMTDCVFLQKRYLKENKITVDKACTNLEKIWGEKRFEADCNRKGGRNEGY